MSSNSNNSLSFEARDGVPPSPTPTPPAYVMPWAWDAKPMPRVPNQIAPLTASSSTDSASEPKAVWAVTLDLA